MLGVETRPLGRALEFSLECTEQSREFLKKNDGGMLVLVREGDRVVVGFGPLGHSAGSLVDSITKEAWRTGVVDVGSSAFPKLIGNVSVQTCNFAIQRGLVYFSHGSMEFPYLENGVFQDNTADVLMRFIYRNTSI